MRNNEFRRKTAQFEMGVEKWRGEGLERRHRSPFGLMARKEIYAAGGEWWLWLWMGGLPGKKTCREEMSVDALHECEWVLSCPTDAGWDESVDEDLVLIPSFTGYDISPEGHSVLCDFTSYEINFHNEKNALFPRNGCPITYNDISSVWDRRILHHQCSKKLLSN